MKPRTIYLVSREAKGGYVNRREGILVRETSVSIFVVHEAPDGRLFTFEYHRSAWREEAPPRFGSRHEKVQQLRIAFQRERAIRALRQATARRFRLIEQMRAAERKRSS